MHPKWRRISSINSSMHGNSHIFSCFFFGGDGLYIYIICICYNSHGLRDRNLYSMYVSLSEDVISDVWLPPTKHRTQVLEFG